MPAKEEFIYRHTVANRFQVTGVPGEQPFDFKNHILRITDPVRNARFLEICDTMHPRDRSQIRIVNSEAAANLERSLGSRVSREAFDTNMVRSGVNGPDGRQRMSQVEIDSLAEEQRLNDALAAQNGGLDQVALDEAAKLIAEGKTGDDGDAARLQRIAEQDAADLAAGQVDQSAVAAAEAAATAEVEVKSTKDVPHPTAAGLKAIKKP